MGPALADDGAVFTVGKLPDGTPEPVGFTALPPFPNIKKNIHAVAAIAIIIMTMMMIFFILV
jgi:hypothetical protein